MTSQSTLQSVPALGTRPASGVNPSRAETREQLAKASYDLLVIGGGILGISTAWHAAQAGLRVALVDAGDFAGATSSASSRLGREGVVGVGGRAVGAGDLALGVGRREGLEVGVSELDGLRIWPRRRRDGSGGLGVVEGGVATAGHHLGRRRRRGEGGSFGAEQSVPQRKRQGGS
jgi:glycine/D-amino acid oxidase-like deaminating enzyme